MENQRVLNNDNNDITVLVTGASGYLAIHCVQQLLQNGYRVRGTVRSLKNMAKVTPLKELDENNMLELVEADLEQKEDWPRVVQGCKYILHVASPLPMVPTAEIIEIAINGTLNVLKAANECFDVKKVVLTSSCSAVNEGHTDYKRVYNEDSWTNLSNPVVNSYYRSKTLAEMAAWDYWKHIKDGNKFDFTVLNPTLIVGPLLTDEQGVSVSIIKRFLTGKMQMVPQFQLTLVDVRDTAKAHVIAMTEPKTNGQRILLVNTPSIWFQDIARILAKEFNPKGYSVSTWKCPYFLLRVASIFDEEARTVLPRHGTEVRFDNSKIRELLNMELIEPEKSLIDMVNSMIDRGILPRKEK